MEKEIKIAVVTSIITGTLTMAGSFSFGLFDKTIKNSQVEEVASLLVDEKIYSNTLITRLASDKRFKGEVGDRGEKGNKGERGEKGSTGDFVVVFSSISSDELRERHTLCSDKSNINSKLSSPYCTYAIQQHCKVKGYLGGFYQELKGTKKLEVLCIGRANDL